MRVGNDGWEVDNLPAVARRTFVVDFPNSVSINEEDTNLPEKLRAEMPAFVIKCLHAFYDFYGDRARKMRWQHKDWHRLPLMKCIFTKESRCVQHAIVNEIQEGRMRWGGSMPVSVLDHIALNFKLHPKRIAGPTESYKLVSASLLGWSQEDSPFNFYIEGDTVYGLSLLSQGNDTV